MLDAGVAVIVAAVLSYTAILFVVVDAIATEAELTKGTVVYIRYLSQSSSVFAALDVSYTSFPSIHVPLSAE